MKTSQTVCSLLSLVSAALLASAVPSYGGQTSVRPRVEIHRESIAATVVSVDYETRAVTLEFADNSLEQFVVGAEVERLNEVVAGDTVVVDHTNALGMELRAPTAEEVAEPFLVLEGDARSAMEELPAGAIGRKIRAVATVEILDRIHGTATLVGSNGIQLTIKVPAQDKSHFPQVRIGDTVVVTYAEAVVVALKKQVESETK